MPAQQQQGMERKEIEVLIAEGNYQAALERLDQMRQRNIADAQVNELIRWAVSSEVDRLVATHDYDKAIGKLAAHVKARPYLEKMEEDLKSIYLKRLEYTLKTVGYQQGVINEMDKLFPNDAEFRYQAGLVMAGGGYVGWALRWFDRTLELDPSYRDRQEILTYAKETLANEYPPWVYDVIWKVIGKYYYNELKSELLALLNSEHDRARVNAYLILSKYGQEDLARQDLLPFHRLNLLRLKIYVPGSNRWAFDYFDRLTDPTRIQQAIAVLWTAWVSPQYADSGVVPRADIFEAIDRLVGKIDVPVWVKALQDVDEVTRVTAAFSLGKLGDPRTVPTLVKALGDTDVDRNLRKGAAEVLGKMGSAARDAVPALVKALRDEYNYVRREAARALGSIGSDARAAVPALIKALRDEDKYNIPWAAAGALGSIGPDARDALPALMEALRDQDWGGNLHRYAVIALGKIGDPRAVPALVKALRYKSSWTREGAAIALGQFGPNARDAVPDLIAGLQDDEGRVRSAAAIALGKIGPDARDAVPFLYEALKDKSQDVRSAAAETLVEIGMKKRD